MLDLGSVMIGSVDSTLLGKFYEKVFMEKPDMDEGGYYGFDTGSCYLTIGPHDKVKGKSKNPERIILNFTTKEIKKEFSRLKKLGAKVVAEPYQMGADMGAMWIATLEDPEGNYFQLMTPWT